MTTPAAPQPTSPGQPQGQPDPGTQPAGPTPGSGEPASPGAPASPEPQAPADPAAELERVKAALAHERQARKVAQDALDAQRQASMTDAEKAVAKAKAEGAAEARREAALLVAAAEFRAIAQGKLADPLAALEVLDLAKFVNDAGDVDKAELAKLVDKLAAALPSASPGKVPAGARGQAADGDFLRGVLHTGR